MPNPNDHQPSPPDHPRLATLKHRKVAAIAGTSFGLLMLAAGWSVYRAYTAEVQPRTFSKNETEAMATQAYQEGEQQGTAEGIEQGQRAAMMPTIGDATRGSAMMLAEADNNSLDLLNDLMCSRRSAWIRYAEMEAGAENTHGQIKILEEKLSSLATSVLEDLIIQYPRQGDLKAQGEQWPVVVNPILENRAIVLALQDLSTGETSGCLLDPVAAITSNNAYLLQSGVAASQRREIIKELDAERQRAASSPVVDESEEDK